MGKDKLLIELISLRDSELAPNPFLHGDKVIDKAEKILYN